MKKHFFKNETIFLCFLFVLNISISLANKRITNVRQNKELIFQKFFTNKSEMKSSYMFTKDDKYPNFELELSDKDLSVFDLENAREIIQGVRHGGYRGENEIIMYDKNNYVQTNKYGYEFLINENYEVISQGTNVEFIQNGYIVSGHTAGEQIIKEKIKIGDFIIYIRETNSIYVFDNKIEYKYAFYLNSINNYLSRLYNKMREEEKYEELYEKLLSINTEYKKIKNSYENKIIDFYKNIEELYNQYFNEKEVIDKTKFKYSNNEKMSEFKYTELYTDKNSVSNSNLIIKMEVSHEGGDRGENELVLYDITNFRGTNVYGYEVEVDKNGNIIAKNTNVELTDENGYILSGHGINANLIENILKIGDYLVYDNKNKIISVYRDINICISNSIGKQIDTFIKTYNELLLAKRPLYYDEIVKRINKLIYIYNSINDKNTFNVKAYKQMDDYESLYFEIKFLFIESNPVHIQSMWHTPNSYPYMFDETTEEGVKKFLKASKECGFNRIYIETNSVGISYYNSKILNNHQYFSKNYGNYLDFLECFIEEAHKLNIEVIAWVQVFRAKDSYFPLESCYKEEWLSIDYNGNKCLFFDSTNPEVHQFLLKQFTELISTYNIDGIEYDYIRYDGSNILSYPSEIIDYGYTEVSINMFKEKYGYTGDIKDILKDHKARSKWVEFKKNRITDLLIDAKEVIKNIKPNCKISASVFSYSESINELMQDWPRWINEELIDYIEPMIYQKNNELFFESVQNFWETIINKDEKTKNKIIIGIGNVCNGGNYYDYPEQIRYVLEQRFSYNIFEASFFFPFIKLTNTFKIYSINPISYSSNIEDKIQAINDDLTKKIDEYYSKISDFDFSKIKKALNNCISEPIEDNFEICINEIKLINDDKIKENIYNIFYKIKTE